MDINVNNFVVYYDEQDDVLDGNGWNFILVPGSTALRFPSLHALVDYIARDSEWLTSYLSVNSAPI